MNNKEIIIVADYFSHEFTGGAELTTDALLNHFMNMPHKQIKSQHVSLANILIHKDKLWVFTNIDKLNRKLIPHIVKHLSYVCIEYDFKFCPERNIEKFKFINDRDWIGSIPEIEQFLQGAKVLFFMSAKQMKIHFKYVSGLDPERCVILGSVFNEADIAHLRAFRSEAKDRSKWLIVYSESWVKGSKKAVEYAVLNSLDFEIVEKVDYIDLLKKLSEAEGLIYMPAGADTCPRLVIEAKLAGCKLRLNELVLHKDEPWFRQDPDRIEEHLKEGPKIFWTIVSSLIKKEKSDGIQIYQ